MTRKLLNFSLVLVLVPLFYAFTYQGILFLASISTLDAIEWFLLGAALSLLAYVLLLNHRIDFVEHFLHEMEHASVSFLFTFQLPGRMEIDPNQGSKTFVPTTGGCIMLLAPYYFPLLTFPILILKALAALAFSLLKVSFPIFLIIGFDLLIGATLLFHFVCTLKEFGTFQTDITKSGTIASVVMVLFLNFVFLVLSMTVVTGSYTQFLSYLKIGLLPALGHLVETVKARFCPACSPTPAP
jgi:hypothetical protein